MLYMPHQASNCIEVQLEIRVLREILLNVREDVEMKLDLNVVHLAMGKILQI